MKYQNLLTFFGLRENLKLSERDLSETAHLSRGGLRAACAGLASVSLETLIKVATPLQRKICIMAVPDDIDSSLSILATAYKIENDGFNSWRVHLMDFIDEWRRTLDPRLIVLPPPPETSAQIAALLAATTHALCLESHVHAPDWATKKYFLNTPWFVAETESLKASALLESALPFRQNNIFVLNNFLQRI